jgi:hypothetical protein
MAEAFTCACITVLKYNMGAFAARCPVLSDELWALPVLVDVAIQNSRPVLSDRTRSLVREGGSYLFRRWLQRRTTGKLD